MCSIYFQLSDYARNLWRELLNYCPANARILKDDAIPNQRLPLLIQTLGLLGYQVQWQAAHEE